MSARPERPSATAGHRSFPRMGPDMYQYLNAALVRAPAWDSRTLALP
jgi:hypothetical protein